MKKKTKNKYEKDELTDLPIYWPRITGLHPRSCRPHNGKAAPLPGGCPSMPSASRGSDRLGLEPQA